MKLIIYTDGGARGNPGPAGIGVVIYRVSPSSEKPEVNNSVLVEFGKCIGSTTNNVAEYTAVIEALRWIAGHTDHEDRERIEFHLDSSLVVNQVNGVFRVKDGKLRSLLTAVRILEQEIGDTIRYQYVPREQNRRADALVNRALDTVGTP
ncbi:MAG: ribonuclease HI family protein [bacterium]|nr:ribonuclease HI family protein [bacterium]